MSLSLKMWRRDPVLWVEAFAVANIAFLALDIYLAHSVNAFRQRAEFIPLYFSMGAPLLLGAGIFARFRGRTWLWVFLGHVAGWSSLAIGLAGVLFHLESAFFAERTLKSLTYAAPFAAPLAYAGLGLLLIMNRMVPADSKEWAQWVLLLALGGFAGNFALSLTDHAINGFFHFTEWIPVISSAFAAGFLLAPFLAPVTRGYLVVCAYVMLAQALVGALGFGFHLAANLKGPSAHMLQNFIDGAPPFAPLLFPNLVVLALIALWALDPARFLTNTGTGATT
ncbi:MAG: hypothetical protein ABUS51_09890 [Acidobacteriota bacterium]